MAATTQATIPTTKLEWPWAKIAWSAVLLLACYGDVLFQLVQEWATDDDMSHGFFVPVVAGYVVWQRRQALADIRPKGSMWGLVLLIWAGFQLVVGTLGAEMFVARTSFMPALVGLLLYIGGFELVRELGFPLFLLLFMFRIPAIIYKQITFPLQMFASQVAERALSWLSIPVLREGNILELASQRLNVVEACSGIRSLLSLSFLALVYAYFFDSKRWMRWALLVTTVPIAVTANAFRVTATGVVSEWKKEFAQGFFHSMEGWVVFLIAFVFLIGTHQFLDRTHSFFLKKRS